MGVILCKCKLLKLNKIDEILLDNNQGTREGGNKGPTKPAPGSPGLTLTALVSLALGIGATTAVFSVIYAGLINPYPFTAAHRIVRLTMQSKAGQADWINLNGVQVRQVRRFVRLA